MMDPRRCVATALALVALLGARAGAEDCSTCGRRVGGGGLLAAFRPDPCLCHAFQRPYSTSSCLYGYPDHVYGRGPVVDLGASALTPGFRGYGPLGSPGYGVGLMPTTRIDRLGAAKPRFFDFGRGRD